MEAPTTSVPTQFWDQKRTYLWLLAGIGAIDGGSLVLQQSHPQIEASSRLFIAFALNVAVLGWCHVDAKEKMVPISGFLRLVMLLIAIIGVPWYFVRSRGLFQAAKGWFGLGLFAVWFVAAFLAIIVGVIAVLLLSR